ncbi:CMRF35-like molecule 1 isoform X1 [Podarcis lilfordi]|uniref:CMRF35-like molecule 1 isoform X1 n=1 Tax=Podarcis lilfordi TaxID=74358 RepID=A0AA35JWF2_9SAUR|nr:CMRF35-like molecule 1 isoform X1 [Podarcis lilfordi]
MSLWRNWMLLTWVLLAGCMSDLTGPKALSGFLGRSLSVRCRYDVVSRKYVKYWCKGSSWSSCEIVVRTTGSEEERTASRVFIKENHSRLEFRVRLENLTQEDAGIYWCGIQRTGSDYGFPVNITVLPASSSDSEETTAISRQSEPDRFLITTTQEQTNKQSGFSPIPTEYLIYGLFALKTLIFLGLVIAIIWMHRRYNQKRPSAATRQENAAQ